MGHFGQTDQSVYVLVYTGVLQVRVQKLYEYLLLYKVLSLSYLKSSARPLVHGKGRNENNPLKKTKNALW